VLAKDINDSMLKSAAIGCWPGRGGQCASCRRSRSRCPFPNPITSTASPSPLACANVTHKDSRHRRRDAAACSSGGRLLCCWGVFQARNKLLSSKGLMIRYFIRLLPLMGRLG